MFDDQLLKLLLTLIPGVILIIGGYLFQKYKKLSWNIPLYFLFSCKQRINVKVGRLWVILGLLTSLITLVFKPTIPVAMTLYFIAIFLSWIIVYVHLKLEMNQS